MLHTFQYNGNDKQHCRSNSTQTNITICEASYIKMNIGRAGKRGSTALAPVRVLCKFQKHLQ